MFLELKNTDIGYKTPLIKGVNASLSLGEVCLLIGNNGAGKTTLIKSILNQIPTLSGSMFIDSKNTINLSPKDIAEKIAVVFSKAQIPANYTVEDLISLGKYIHYPYYFELNVNDKKEVAEIIESLNLNQYKNLTLQKLSDGNLQKAFIGRAFAQNSPMIILDEPTTHLDEDNKIIILKLLREFARKYNKLILFSSHDWRLAKEFADKIWFVKGQKLYTGIAEDVLSAHPDLSDPVLFDIHKNFIPPHISAPEFQKELLYSLLQKNFKNNLSPYHFTFSEGIWIIESNNSHQNFTSFEEIILFLRNSL